MTKYIIRECHGLYGETGKPCWEFDTFDEAYDFCESEGIPVTAIEQSED